MPKTHHKMLEQRNISPDRRRRVWLVRDYNNSAGGSPVVGRVEMVNDAFQAIRPNDEIVGVFATLTAARAALLGPVVKRRIDCV
jgi:hypothetical protein